MPIQSSAPSRRVEAAETLGTPSGRPGESAAAVRTDDIALNRLPKDREPAELIEWERHVLGGLLVTDMLDEVSSILSPEDFSRECHGRIFAVMLELHARGATTADFDAVAVELEADAQGKGYLAELAGARAPYNAPYWAGKVREAAIERRKHDVAHGLLDGLPLAEAMEQLRKLLTSEKGSNRAMDGATFIFDQGETVEPLWGDGEAVLWAKGEPMQIVGPQGVGKTTVLLQLALSGHGVIAESQLLGLPVTPSDGKGLYIAADRPRQASRSARRMVKQAHREALTQKLIVWPGPLPFDLGRCDRGDLTAFVASFPEVTRVYIDSLKDVAVKPAGDEEGSRINAQYQELVAAGYDAATNHHQRKSSADNKRPTKLDDVYGSTWITAGAGSVLLIWGQPGDPIVEAKHLKQPAAEVGPLTLRHDHSTGTVALHETPDLLDIAAASLGDGVTVKAAAAQLFGVSNPDRNQVEKTRHRIKSLVTAGKLERTGENPDTYRRRS